MTIIDLLTKIRDSWLKEIAQKIREDSRGGQNYESDLIRFYDLLVQVIETGEMESLSPLLAEWVSSHSELELEGSIIRIPPILDKIVKHTGDVAKEHLEPDQAIDVIQALMPIFTFSFEAIATQEVLARFSHFSEQVELAQADLELIDKSKSDFISVAAHELRTPLTLIEGYASMLRENLAKEEDGDTPELLLIKGINNGTRRLQEIVDDMIDVSMIDNNLLILNFQPTWLNRLFEVLENDVKGFVKERNQILEILAFEGSQEMTFADSERLYQSIRNLVTNAIKYTPDGGKIIVDGRLLDGFIEVTVQDNGIGIDQEDQKKIFKKFGGLGEVARHSSGKTKFKGGGPGLGLPITKGIIDAHGGRIWVESEGYNEETYPGSKFFILIPLRTEPPDDKVAKLFKPMAGGGESQTDSL